MLGQKTRKVDVSKGESARAGTESFFRPGPPDRQELLQPAGEVPPEDSCTVSVLGPGSRLHSGAGSGSRSESARVLSEGSVARSFADMAVSFDSCQKHARTLRAVFRAEIAPHSELGYS